MFHFKLCRAKMSNIFPNFILILMVSYSDPQRNTASYVSVNEILKSLEKVIDYSMRNPNSIGLSGIFGVVRAKALITNLFFAKNEQILLLYLIEKKCEDILKLKRNILKQHDYWVINVSDPLLWSTKITYKYVEEKCYNLSKNQTKKLLNKLRNEAETACITPEMFEFCLNNSYNMEQLKFHPACSYFLLGKYKGIGYETTHRLLFTQITRAWQLFPQYQETNVVSLCKYIYQQARATEGNKYFFDLFLEQIFLCGVEGFREFLNVKWLRIILENQLEEGCFPLFSKKAKVNSSSVYDRQCSDHATGLASAVLALHVHFKSQCESSSMIC